jgi:hypothetical protein
MLLVQAVNRLKLLVGAPDVEVHKADVALVGLNVFFPSLDFGYVLSLFR